MALRVVGAGFGRTGTHSLKFALEKLLGAPCYHMVEVFMHPEHVRVWHDAALDKPVDQFTMTVGKGSSGGGELKLMWENTQFSAPFTVQK